MNRKELNAILAEKVGLSRREVDKVIAAMIDEIQLRLSRGESVKLQGIGTFEMKPRAPRKGRDLVKGEEVLVPARVVPVFRASKALKNIPAQGNRFQATPFSAESA